jgi:hypothetical protein
MRISILVIVGLLISGSAMAAENIHSGNFMHKHCTAGAKKYHSRGVCLGFLIASQTYLLLLNGAKIENFQPLCISDNVTGGQLKDIFIKYLEDHPELRHHASTILFVNAMRGAFPCKK